MISEVKKKQIVIRCPHCGEKADEAWIMTYQSKSYNRVIYMCVYCREVIKITEEDLSENQQLIYTNQ